MNEPRVTTILKESNLLDFSMVRQDIMARAQNFGHVVHKITELWDLGTLNIDSVDPAAVLCFEGWKKFRKDFGLSFKPEEIEHRLTSKLGFSGTPDRWHTEKGILVDIKSSSSMLPAVAIQTAAYQILIEENTGIKIKKRIGVQLTEKGYKIEPYDDRADRAVFLSCLNVYRWKQRHNMLDKRQQ